MNKVKIHTRRKYVINIYIIHDKFTYKQLICDKFTYKNQIRDK